MCLAWVQVRAGHEGLICNMYFTHPAGEFIPAGNCNAFRKTSRHDDPERMKVTIDVAGHGRDVHSWCRCALFLHKAHLHVLRSNLTKGCSSCCDSQTPHSTDQVLGLKSQGKELVISSYQVEGLALAPHPCNPATLARATPNAKMYLQPCHTG